MTVDLRTRYLGLELRSPIVASAAPHNGDPAMARRLERAGRRGDRPAVAVRGGDPPRGDRARRARSSRAPSEFAEALDYFPRGRNVRGRRRPLPAPRSSGSRPPSRSRSSPASTRARVGGWVPLRAAHPGRRRRRPRAEPVPRGGRPAANGGRHGGTATSSSIAAVRAVDHASRWPSSSARTTRRSPTSPRRPSAPGADGLVLFNRFYQPDLDLETLEVVPRLELSQPWELRLPVRWIAILRPQLDPDVSLAATSGVALRRRRGQGA